MKFCTAVNCLDGRVQLPVIGYLRRRFGVEFVDCVTEAGPNLILSARADEARVAAVLNGVGVSVTKHDSVGIAIAGHHDCAGNPSPREKQIIQINESVAFIKTLHPKLEVIGLWVDDDWTVTETGELGEV